MLLIVHSDKQKNTEQNPGIFFPEEYMDRGDGLFLFSYCIMNLFGDHMELVPIPDGATGRTNRKEVYNGRPIS